MSKDELFTGYYIDDPYGGTFSGAEPLYWEPLNTAPKDGTYFIGYCTEVDEIEIYAWSENSNDFMAFYSHDCIRQGYWMPLPAAPKCSIKKENSDE